MLHMLDCFPAAVLIMRVAATRGSWITLLVGYMYAVSFTAVQVLVLSELFLWDRCNDGVTEGVRNLGLRLSRRRFGDLSLSRKFLVRDDGWAKNGLRLYCAIVSGPVVMLLLLCVCFVIWQKADLDYFHMMFGTDMRVLVDPLVLVLGTAGLGLVVDLVAYFFSATGVVALWTFVHGSVVFVRAYEEVGTYRPGWMDWLG